MRHRGIFIACSIALVTACSGGSSGSSGVPAAGGNHAAAKTVAVPIVVSIPTKSSLAAKRPQFVSPNTQSIAVFVYAPGAQIPATPTATVNIASTSQGCSLNAASTAISCTVVVMAPIGTAEITLQDYSGQNGTGSLLATGTQNVTVAAGMAPVTFTLDGTPAIIRLMLQTPVLALGSAGTTTLDVDAYDASGALIVAPGNFSAPLTVSSDSSAVTLSASSAPGPGTQIAVTYGGSASAPYAVHFSGSGGGIASNLIVGATLDLDPAQSLAFLSGSGGTSFGVALIATTAGNEPPQSFTYYTAPAYAQLNTGQYYYTLQPNQTLVTSAYDYTQGACSAQIYPAGTTSNPGALVYPVSTSTYTCAVAAEPSGNLLAISASGISEYSVSGAFMTSNGNTINAPSAAALAVDASGTIAVLEENGGTDTIATYAANAANAGGTASPTASTTLSTSTGFAQFIAIANNGNIYVAGSTNTTPPGYFVNEYSPSLALTGSIAQTPPAPSDYENVDGLAVDAAGEVIVSYTLIGSSSYSLQADVYSAGDTTAPTRTIPLTTQLGNKSNASGPVVVPSPAPPSPGAGVAGDMFGYKPGRTWTYQVNQSGGSPYYLGVYADPNLVNGNVRLVGYQSTTSNPFSGGTQIGSVDLTPLDGGYLAAGFTSVSSGTNGITATVPGTPLFVPASLAVNQVWNPLANANFIQPGVSTNAQVVNIGAVEGIGACPAGSAPQGGTVVYTISIAGSSAGGGASRVSFVPGCGITDVQTSDGATDIVLQSVGSNATLGQVTVPAGQPAIVAALHALWQRTLGVHPH